MTDTTYPPLDVPKPVGPDIWIVDSGPLRVMGVVPLPVRMTVVRLGDGGLLLHSPTRFSPGLLRDLEGIGPVRHLVAPNSAHWSFVQDWQRELPRAVTWAAPGLRARRQVRRSGLRIDRELRPEASESWPDELRQLQLRGAGGFCEIALFHEGSRTLILTDLVVNLEPGKLPLAFRPFARLAGTTAPDGRAPVYLRAVVKAGGEAASEAARRMLALAPDRVIFSHGRWFDSAATERLQRSWRWLL